MAFYFILFPKYNTTQTHNVFIDDIIGASSLLKEHNEQFIQYMQSLHPAIESTYNITDKKLPFPDTEMTSIDVNTISTSVY